MKSLLKFTLLAALIISGKLTKQTSTASAAQTIETKTTPNTLMVFVNQTTALEPTKTNDEKSTKQQSNAGLLADMF
ncbi:hypothetical protein [Hymenobacter lapidarius]|uniref:hypothetical protein n=1 Tax=Hymenobacter lapidarius TaxID=1908237 RepID=UPI000F778137|nr:hypothetical protein [Hymenobacter lapidarius]